MTTTDKSRADALTQNERDAFARLVASASTFPDHNGRSGPVTRVGYTDLQTIVALVKREILSPASQPAAAPIDEPTIPAELHHDTAKLVRRFARALANKLLAAQRKYGYSDNWMRDGWADECRAELMRHIQKGDPRDVAAYCAFLWHHNESTAPAPSPVDERAAFNHPDFRDDACEQDNEHARAASANETGAEGTDAFAHEVWSAAQRAPGEGIEDAVQRVAAILSRSPAK